MQNAHFYIRFINVFLLLGNFFYYAFHNSHNIPCKFQIYGTIKMSKQNNKIFVHVRYFDAVFKLRANVNFTSNKSNDTKENVQRNKFQASSNQN
jgi:hypothetical protein